MTTPREIQNIIESLDETVSNFYKIDPKMYTRAIILQSIAINGNVVKCLNAPTREYRIAAMQSNIPYFDAVIMNEIKKYPDIFDQFQIQPEELCIAAIRQNVNVVAYIRPEFQTDAVCEIAININPKIVHHLKNISKQARICAIEQNVKTGETNIQDVPFEYQTQQMCVIAILKNPNNLIYTDCNFRTYDICFHCVSKDGMLIKHVPKIHHTIDIIKKAAIETFVDHNWSAYPYKRINHAVLQILPVEVFTPDFKHFLIDFHKSIENIPHLTQDDYIYACSKYIECAKNISNWSEFEDVLYTFAHTLMTKFKDSPSACHEYIAPITTVGMTIDMFKKVIKINREFGILATTDEWKLAAIDVDPFSITYYEKRFGYNSTQESDRICIAGVKKDARVLKIIHYQNFPICMEAIRANPLAMKFINQQRPDKCIEGVKIDYRSMQYVRDQTASICVPAMIADPRCIQFIRDQVVCYTFVVANPQFEIYIKNKSEYNNFAKLYKKSAYFCP
jgi:hypothetical protein